LKKKVYSPEFKQQIIKEVEETGNAALVARRHEVSPNTVQGWIKKTKSPKVKIDINNPIVIKEVEKENEHLKKILGEKDLEIAILKDLLKKTNPQLKIK